MEMGRTFLAEEAKLFHFLALFNISNNVIIGNTLHPLTNDEVDDDFRWGGHAVVITMYVKGSVNITFTIFHRI